MLFPEVTKQGYPNVTSLKKNWLGLFLCYMEFVVSLKDKADQIDTKSRNGKSIFGVCMLMKLNTCNDTPK